MKSDTKILLAFFLNLFFSVVEFFGGAVTGSIAIISDSLHDFGDSLSIGISYVFERISKKSPDAKYSYGYLRFSLLGSVITTTILIFGSAVVIYNSILRLFNPIPINYDGMIIMSLVGIAINFVAAYSTHGGHSLNQRAVSLHMLEDVLGWVTVLIGALLMKFTDTIFLDSIMSMGVAVFILINAIKNLGAVLDVFLEKTPNNIDPEKITKHILSVDGVIDIHHLHITSIDGFNHKATLHLVTDKSPEKIKKAVKEELNEHGIAHSTIEIETPEENCCEKECHRPAYEHNKHHHHHHH